MLPQVWLLVNQPLSLHIVMQSTLQYSPGECTLVRSAVLCVDQVQRLPGCIIYQRAKQQVLLSVLQTSLKLTLVALYLWSRSIT